MEADSTGANGPGAPAAWGLAALWGLMSGALWLVAFSILQRPTHIDGLQVGFLAAGVAIAIVCARFVPRVHGSVALLAIAGLMGTAISLTLTIRDRTSGEVTTVLTCLALLGPLTATRLLLDMFGRRWSVTKRRVAACVLVPFVVFLFVTMFSWSRGMRERMTGTDIYVTLTSAALGLAIVPPRRLEVRRAD